MADSPQLDNSALYTFLQTLGGGLQRMANPLQPSPEQGGSTVPGTNKISDLSPSNSQDIMTGVPSFSPAPEQGGFRGRLHNAMLMASMIPGGPAPMSAGQNISQVAGAMVNLPYARLAHQYQMGSLPLQYAAAQAEVAKNRSQAEYYSNRNQAAIQSMYLRGVAAAQATAQLRAQDGKVEFGMGEGANGAPSYGRYEHSYQKGDPNNPEDVGKINRKFVPLMPWGDYIKSQQEVRGHDLQSELLSNPTRATQLMLGLPRGENETEAEFKHRQAVGNSMLGGLGAVAGVTGAAGAGGRSGAEDPYKKGDTAYRASLDVAKKSAADFKEKLNAPVTMADRVAYLEQQGKDASNLSMSDMFSVDGEIQNARRNMAQRVDSKLQEWLNLSPAEQKKNPFATWLQSQPEFAAPLSTRNPAKPTPTKRYNPDTQKIEPQ